MKQILTAFIISFLLTAAQAEAAFRCPNGNLVDTGDSIAVVSVKCDAPASISKSSVPAETEGGKIKYNEIQDWVYTEGSSLMHTLTFVNGVLISVTTGGFTR